MHVDAIGGSPCRRGNGAVDNRCPVDKSIRLRYNRHPQCLHGPPQREERDRRRAVVDATTHWTTPPKPALGRAAVAFPTQIRYFRLGPAEALHGIPVAHVIVIGTTLLGSLPRRLSRATDAAAIQHLDSPPGGTDSAGRVSGVGAESLRVAMGEGAFSRPNRPIRRTSRGRGRGDLAAHRGAGYRSASR